MIMPVSLPIKVVFVIQISKHKAVLYHHKHVSTHHMYQLYVCWIWLKIWCYCIALNLSHFAPRAMKHVSYKWTWYKHNLWEMNMPAPPSTGKDHTKLCKLNI
jgi:hypothetical protein